MNQCCCCSLKTGALTAAVYKLVLGLIQVGIGSWILSLVIKIEDEDSSDFGTLKAAVFIGIVMYSLIVIASIFLIIAISKGIRGFVVFWYVMVSIETVLLIVGLFRTFFSGHGNGQLVRDVAIGIGFLSTYAPVAQKNLRHESCLSLVEIFKNLQES